LRPRDHKVGDILEQPLVDEPELFVKAFSAVLGKGSSKLDLCARWHENSSWRIEVYFVVDLRGHGSENVGVVHDDIEAERALSWGAYL